MKIYIVDITGKTPLYDASLVKSIHDLDGVDHQAVLLSPNPSYAEGNVWFRKLYMPLSRFFKKNSPLRKVCKGLESILNYLSVIRRVAFNRPDIIHFQWLPYTEKSSKMDILFISLLKSVHAKSKVFLTVHNLTPHNVTGAALDSFMDIFKKVMRHIDGFIVHTSSTKGEFCSLFDVNPEKVSVVRHGIFDKGELPPRINTDSSVCNVLMYGTQSFYKGTDILVDSLTYLPENVRQQLSVKIVGMTDQTFYNEHSDKAKELGVEWRNALISDEELKELLSWSDVIVLPYRKISQSGVLLETIYYEKPLIISDMPSFVETLSGYEQAMIFKAGDSKELSQSLNNFVSGNLDMDLVFNVIKTKKAEYSWENSAKQTIFAYLYNC